MVRPKIFACFCLGMVTITARAADTYFTADGAVSYDSNIARAEHSVDIDDDFALEASLTAARSFRLGEKSGIVIRAGAQLREQFTYDDLSRLKLDFGAAYRIQPVPGFTNPWIELELDVNRLDHRDSAIRDGWLWNTGVTVGKYFTDRIRLTAGWNYEERNAEKSKVFEWHHNTLSATADYRLGDSTTFYANASRIYGDQVSTASFPSSAGIYDNVAKAIARDRALELGSNDEHRAYRIDAISDVFEIGVNHALRRDLAVDLSMQYYDTDTDGSHTYRGTIGRAGLLYRF